MDSIRNDRCVDTLLTAIGNVGFKVVIDFISLDMSRRFLLDQNPLLKISENFVANNGRVGVVIDLDPGKPIIGNPVITKDPWNTVASLGPNSIIEIALDLIIDDLTITPDVVSAEGGVRPDVNSLFVIFIDLVLLDNRFRADDLNPMLIVNDAAPRDQGSIGNPDLDPRSLIIVDRTILNPRLGVLPYKTNADFVVVDYG